MKNPADKIPRLSGFSPDGIGVQAALPGIEPASGRWQRQKQLKAPFPYFGGKRPVAGEVWRRLGAVDNYIEPFAGSCAVLLLRPTPPNIETVNDLDPYVANFWRATHHAPELVAQHADWPVNESDLHARHKWLVLSDDAAAFRRRMRTDPNYFDTQIAGWWCWGLCCWIGGGWCTAPEDLEPGDRDYTGMAKVPAISHTGKGINAKTTAHEQRKPNLGGLKGQHGRGVHNKRPRLSGAKGNGDGGTGGEVGVNKAPTQRRPDLSGRSERDRGAGVHKTANDCHVWPAASITAGLACSARRAWLIEWFARLRDRLRTVRVCCGHWFRVCDSTSVTTRLGLTGIFLDPPYGKTAGRDMGLYAKDSATVAEDVRAYCLERGEDRKLRIALAGYEGEGHEVLERKGWSVFAWTAAGGYGNRSAKGKANARKERIWFSPHCLTGQERTLFED